MGKPLAQFCLLGFLALITGCVEGISRSEYQGLEARIAFLESQVDELQNQPEQLLAESRRALEQKDYAAAIQLGKRLIEHHPGSPEAKEVEQLRRVTEARLYAIAWSLPASDYKANIDAYSELAELNPSQSLYREKVAYYTLRLQAQAQRASSGATSGARGYQNSEGNWIPSPTRAPSPPAGASAQCRDGTYSFSQSRRGTCSHHGGVARWL